MYANEEDCERNEVMQMAVTQQSSAQTRSRPGDGYGIVIQLLIGEKSRQAAFEKFEESRRPSQRILR